MSDRFKKALLGPDALAGFANVPKLVSQALLPVSGVSDELHARCVAYVLDGSDPGLLMELDRQLDPLLEHLLGSPGKLALLYQTHQQAQALLTKLGLIKRGSHASASEAVLGLRNTLYLSSAPSDLQWARFGRLLALLGDGPNRTTQGVPDWFTALINDVVATVPDQTHRNGSLKGRLAQLRPSWGPERLGAVLLADGMAPEDVPTAVLLGLFQSAGDPYYWLLSPDGLPGIDAFLAAHGHAVPASAMGKLAAVGRTKLAEHAASDPSTATGIAHLLAALSVDTSKLARAAAIKALDAVAAGPRAVALGPVLAKAPAARAGELVEFLVGAEGGPALLTAAASANPKIATLVNKTAERRETITASEPEVQPVEVPPFKPIRDLPAAPAKAELRRALNKEVEQQHKGKEPWRAIHARRAAQITDAHLDELVAVADGRWGKAPKVLSDYGIGWVAHQAPSLTLAHLLRLVNPEEPFQFNWIVEMRTDADTDPRAIEDALARAGHAGRVDIANHVWTETDPEAAWPWAALHPDIVRERLGAAEWAVKTLRIVEHFPTLPPDLLPAVAAHAVGTAKASRSIAQRALSGHPTARPLAEQALGDSRGEVRAAAASWLGALADPAAVPALRAALAKEKREVVRAGLLSALEALGDDISAELSASTLLAEAVKGLKASAPASLAWFDFGLLPSVRWADGTPVDERVVRWWVVLADKLKDPSGQGLIDRYLSLLEPVSAGALGTVVLKAWVAQDTRHPADADSRAYAAAMGPERHQLMQEWYARVRSDPNRSAELAAVEQYAAVPLERQIADAYAEHQRTYVGSATADKGLLALTTRMPGIELGNAVQAYLRNNPGRRSQTEALMFALSANGQPAALQVLLGVARRHKMAGVQATALRLVEGVADARGWTPDELADRTIPSAGFGDDRLLHLDYGDREFIGRLSPAGAIELSTADGKSIKALPAARQGEDEETVKETKKQLTVARKEAKSLLTMQTARLYEAMCTGRRWSVADWSEFLAGHPLVSQLVTRLVWLENAEGPGQRAFRPTEDGALINVFDETIELGAGASIGLAHATLLPASEVEAWRSHLTDYAVTPLFDQLSATVPAFAAGAMVLDDLAGHLTDTFSFRGVAGKRGYGRAASEDGAWFNEYTKTFTSSGLTAVLEFTGSYLPEDNIPCATESLAFRAKRRPVPLAEVPPVMLAECYTDYAALAALGPYDPDYAAKAAY